MAVDPNRDRDIGGRRPRARDAYGDPTNQPVTINRWTHIFDKSSTKRDGVLYGGRQPRVRGGDGGDRYRRGYHRYDQGDSGDFHLKVNIPSFNGNLDIEEFLDWLAKVDRFFNYIEIPKERRVRLVTC